MKKLFLSSLLMMFVMASMTQTSDSIAYAYNELKLLGLFEKMYATPTTSDKMAFSDSIRLVLKKELTNPETFHYGYENIRQMGKVVSPDLAFRIYNYNLPLVAGEHKYFTFIQFYEKKKEKCRVVELNDLAGQEKGFEQAKIPYQSWYGALYYEIIPVKISGKMYYTLLGLDFNDVFTTKKIIDVMYFTDDKRFITFGAPIFENSKKQLQHRLVFEYSSKVSMSARYNSDIKMIVFDHLSPTKPSLEGKYQFYGPDFSLDALEFKKNKWKFIPDIDIKNTD